jgi:hypothetical protein
MREYQHEAFSKFGNQAANENFLIKPTIKQSRVFEDRKAVAYSEVMEVRGWEHLKKLIKNHSKGSITRPWTCTRNPSRRNEAF